MARTFEKLDKIKDLMHRIDESYHENTLLEYDDFEKRWIDELNDMYKKDGTYGIKLYHSAGMHSWVPLPDVIRSICKNGLSVDSAKDNDGIGNCIWFSSNYDDYAKNGVFVLSIELTGENRVRFELSYDGRNSYAYKSIPFEYLTIEVLPLFKDWTSYVTNIDAEDEDGFIEKRFNGSFFEYMLATAKNNTYQDVIMYVDAWDYMGVPYDLGAIEQFDNIKIDRFGIK